MNGLREAFAEQAGHCTGLESPFMGRLMSLCAKHWPDAGTVADRANNWQGDIGPKSISLPLRIAGGLHALVLTEQAPALAACYPPEEVADEALWRAVTSALQAHADFLLDWIESPPQTNEVRRATALIPVAHMLAARFDMPLRLSEVGASGGLNLNFDQFQLRTGLECFGPESDVRLTPEWSGPCPKPANVQVAERRGVDLNPLNPAEPDDALRLLAYLWPDQADRMARTRAAIALPPAPVDRADAIDWLPDRLTPTPGQLRFVYSTIAWQYLPEARRAEGQALIERAGQSASDHSPLAWVRMEADASQDGAALTLKLWPGDHDLALARVDFHGRWIKWIGPVTLP
ncbi:DUF2332 domain-containing protein [Primorskyibacter sp. S187A]|uniref:DUF2332 domain-containing protein n=1 Tax=Primorskyibacter sp. S187A TaxID=3415130 RepID=UPI003C7E452F